jgi:hypothetical protein
MKPEIVPEVNAQDKILMENILASEKFSINVRYAFSPC